jgi:hypothetical protein
MMEERVHSKARKLASDGLAVPDYLSLIFTPLVIDRCEWTGCIISLSIEWQTDEGKRRPFLVGDIGPIHWQSGWLWGRK